MDSSKIKIKCHSCGNEYETAEMRYSSDGQNLICISCLERKVTPTQERGRPAMHHAAAPAKQPAQQEKPKAHGEEYVEYVCDKCKYAFTRKASMPVTRCPYCSHEGTVSAKSSRSAHSLLEESMDKRYDF
jgi:DNA-directed RNA polymerase subunit RPC12/RpoP